MNDSLKKLFESLVATLPNAKQIRTLEQDFPLIKRISELSSITHLSPAVRKAINIFYSKNRLKLLDELNTTVHSLMKLKLKPDNLESAKKVLAKEKILKLLKEIKPNKEALAFLGVSNTHTPKLTQDFIDAYCTPGQLERMKRAILPPEVRKELAAKVLSPEQKKRLRNSNLPHNLVARIEAAAPNLEYIKKHEVAAARVAKIEKVMMSQKEFNILDNLQFNNNALRELAANRRTNAWQKRMKMFTDQLLKEVKK